MLLGVKDADYILDSPFKSDRLSKQKRRNTMSNQVLRLNADFSVMGTLDWTEAIELLLMEKANLVESVPGKFVRSEHLVIAWPAVISLKRYRQVRSRVRFSSRNVILRDRGVCAYCSVAPKLKDGSIDRSELTMDHVIPRFQGKQDFGTVYLPWCRETVPLTGFRNCVTACKSCNSRKSARSPEQANMPLRYLPRSPTNMDVLRISMGRIRHLPECWFQYLPADFRTMPMSDETGIQAQVIKYTGS